MLFFMFVPTHLSMIVETYYDFRTKIHAVYEAVRIILREDKNIRESCGEFIFSVSVSSVCEASRNIELLIEFWKRVVAQSGLPKFIDS